MLLSMCARPQFSLLKYHVMRYLALIEMSKSQAIRYLARIEQY